MTHNAAIDWCQQAGWYMPRGHCAGARRYARRGREDVVRFIEATEGQARGVCVQAGGHVGHWPKQLAKHYASVLTYEPHPANFRALAANCTRPNVHPMRAALGDGCNLGGVALNEHGRNSGGHHVEPGDDHPAPDMVPQVCVDALELYRLDALVLDTEGAELLAIQGAEKTLARCRPVVLCEERGHIEGKVGTGTTNDLHCALQALGYSPGDWLGHDRIWWPAC